MALSDKEILISPSIIASNLSVFGSLVKELDPQYVDLLHMDVMDGHFVPNMTFGPGYIKDLAEHTEIPMDVHLMIEKPELSLEEYMNSSPWGITIHYESTRFPARLLSEIRKREIVSGLSLNPATPVETVFDLAGYCDMILIMSVDPGFYGQSFMPEALGRIEKLRNFLEMEGLGDDVMIQVDGGINKKNISEVTSAGARVIVAGSSAFKGGNVNENVAELKKNALLDLSV